MAVILKTILPKTFIDFEQLVFFLSSFKYLNKCPSDKDII